MPVPKHWLLGRWCHQRL